MLTLAACGASGQEKSESPITTQPPNAPPAGNGGGAAAPEGIPGSADPGAAAGAPAGGQGAAYPPPSGGPNLQPGAMLTATGGITSTMGGPTMTMGMRPGQTPGAPSGNGPQPGGAGGGRGPGGRGGFSPAAAATALGITEQELMTEMQAGKSIATLASEKSIDLETVKQAILTSAKTQMDEQVSAGSMTQAQADEKYTQLTTNIDEMLNRTGMGPGPGGQGTPSP